MRQFNLYYRASLFHHSDIKGNFYNLKFLLKKANEILNLLHGNTVKDNLLQVNLPNFFEQ